MFMDYALRESITKLATFLRQTRFEKSQPHIDSKAVEEDLLWDASRFLAIVIHKSSFKYYTNYREFLEFKAEYEKTHSIIIDEKALLEKFWLRNIFGFVFVADGISSLCSRFKELKNYKNEILFWLDFQKAQKGSSSRIVEKKTLEDAVQQYEKLNSISLSTDGIFFSRWVSTKEDGKLEYSDFEVYFEHFVRHWVDFDFLSHFENRKSEENTELLISKTEFNNLHAVFQTLYPQIPTVEHFKEQKLLSEFGDNYGFNFYNTEPRYWDLNDKITGHLWELLINDTAYANDEHRLKTWLEKVMYWPQWPEPLQFVTERAKTRFLDTAFELLMNEPDLEGIKSEFAKVFLDRRFSHDNLLSYQKIAVSDEYELNNDDAYEVLSSLMRWEKMAQTTYLYDQGSRDILGILVKEIVINDSEHNHDAPSKSIVANAGNYRRIISLLRVGVEKPFLIWEVTRFLLMYRIEVLPYIICENNLQTLGIALLDEIEFVDTSKSEFNFELWEKSIRLLLDSLEKNQHEASAKKVFQIYRSLNKHKYEIPYNRSNPKLELTTREEHQRKETMVLGLVEDYQMNQNIWPVQSPIYLLPKIFSKLLDVVLNYKSKPFYRNGTVQFPILQWDAMCWLLKTATYWKFHPQSDDIQGKADTIAKAFLDRYLESIEVNEVRKYNYFEEKEEVGLPLWSEKIERLSFIDWIYPVYFINSVGLLNRLLAPRIDIEPTKDQYHKKNAFSADKLRTHIGVLLQVLRKLVLPIVPYGFDKGELIAIKQKIEGQLLDYLRNHVEDQPENGKIDLFDFNKEWRFNSTSNEALFPQIARAVNWFTDRDAIINVISESKDILKLLTLLDLVKSEGVRLKLVDKIKEQDIVQFLEKYSWITEIQHTVSNLAHHPELLPQIQEAITFWKRTLEGSRVASKLEYQKILYKSELLVAYFRKSEEEIDEIPEPSSDYNTSNELHFSDYKLFYRGLLLIQTNPSKAHSIFDNLSKKYRSFPSIALNRMVAKINMAELVGDQNLYREALEEWNQFKISNKDVNTDFLEPELSINIMTILNKAGDYQELEKKYEELDLPNRMQSATLEIVIQSLIDQKKTNEALQLVSSAKTYHQFGNISDIQFITDLEGRINQLDNLDELRGHYFRIFSSEPKKLIKIFPENLNGRGELNEFLVKEIILAADKLLEKIKSIEEIKNEDKYNDLIELAIDARINPWGWQIGAQSRGAFSGTGGKQPGERDLPFMNKNKQVILVCEAFIYRTASPAQEHLQKVFNYYHKREAFVMLIYDLSSSQEDFKRNYEEYANSVVKNTVFPSGFEIQGNVSDISAEFNFKRSAIKVFLSKHTGETILYHVFVNINYRLPGAP